MAVSSRILCAVDFSGPAQAAFEHALALSRDRNAELTAVRRYCGVPCARSTTVACFDRTSSRHHGALQQGRAATSLTAASAVG